MYELPIPSLNRPGQPFVGCFQHSGAYHRSEMTSTFSCTTLSTAMLSQKNLITIFRLIAAGSRVFSCRSRFILTHRSWISCRSRIFASGAAVLFCAQIQKKRPTSIRGIAHFSGQKNIRVRGTCIRKSGFYSDVPFEPETPADLARRILWIRCVECAEKKNASSQRGGILCRG